MADTSDEIESRTRVMLRPIGSPLPLGFFTFGTGMALMAALELHVLPMDTAPGVAIAMIFFVAPLEMLSGVLAFFARDGAAGTLLSLFAVSWLLNGIVFLLSQPGEPLPAVGVFDIAFGAIVACMAVVAWRSKPLFSIILVLAAARFAATAAYEFGGPRDLQLLSGIIAAVLWVVSLYGGTALSLEDARGRRVLPIFRRGAGREAIEGDVHAQLGGLQKEAGVRKQL